MTSSQRPNLLPENTSITRQDVIDFLESPQGASKNSAALKAFLRNKGFSEEEAEKAATDLPSYL